MTDRELLELAAKAAGIIGTYGFASDDFYYRGNTEGILTTLPDGQSYVWNPLTDDGDALRLAVKLRSRVVIDEVWVIERTSIAAWERDPCAATRRAIVRAAAEIGRSMT